MSGAQLPVFVPRTVLAVERSATRLAQRVVAPVRAVGLRSVSFADRLLGTWLGRSGRLPAVAARGGTTAGLPFPRPWYELDAAPEPPFSTGFSTEAAAGAPEQRRAAPAAERGAAIARTPLVAVSPGEVREVARELGGREAAGVAASQSETTASLVSIEAEPARATDAAQATVERERAATTPTTDAARTEATQPRQGPARREELLAEAQRRDRAIAPRPTGPEAMAPTTEARREASAATVAVDVERRVRELLPPVRPARPAPPVMQARPTGSLSRALGHASWVDERLHSIARSDERPAATASYVWVAPADAVTTPAQALVGERQLRGEAPAAISTRRLVAPNSPVPSTATGLAPSPPVTAGAPVAVTVAHATREGRELREPLVVSPRREVALPALGWDATLPPAASASETFVARLFASAAARDVAVPSLRPITPPAREAASAPTAARAPAVVLLRANGSTTAAKEATATNDGDVTAATGGARPAATVEMPPGGRFAPAPVELRPGATAARAEWVAAAINARLDGAWSEAAPAPGAAEAVMATGRPPGPPAIARFLDRLVGVATVRALAPLPLASLTLIAPGAARSTEEAAPLVAAAGRGAVEPARARREETMVPALAAFRTGGLAVRAEQLAGVVGVRAASLAIDFVDPAGLPALTSGRAAPGMAYLWPRAAADGATRAERADGDAREEPLAPARARTAAVAGAAPSLSAMEWALVATFPSSATAAQFAAARSAESWSTPASGAGSVERASAVVGREAALPSATVLPMPGLSAADAAVAAREAAREEPMRAAAMRGEAIAREWVAPVVPIDRASLPDGRLPRGSFTWPRVVGFQPAAERAAQAQSAGGGAPTKVGGAEGALSGVERAAPGTPLWTVIAGERPSQSAQTMRSAAPSVASALGYAAATSNTAARGAGQGGGRGEGGVPPALYLVRPPVETTAEVARFTAQPQPLVHASPGSDSAARIVEAVRREGPSTGDERITLADLTLISIASATQQLAASPEGSRPASAEAVASPAPAAQPAAHGGKSAAAPGPAEIEELARRVYDEYLRLAEIERERSGDPWES